MERRKRTVVCLCGSTRFKQEFIEANYRETMAGKVVLSVGWFSHADAEVYSPTEEEKAALDELHLDKIDMADEVLVLNAKRPWCPRCQVFVRALSGSFGEGLGGRCMDCAAATQPRPYVGDSTRREIAHAEAAGKVVRYLNPPGA